MIDLTKTPLGQVETNYDQYRIKSRILFENIFQENPCGYNLIVVPISVYNMIITNIDFRWGKDPQISEIDSVMYFGDCCGFRCLLDIHMRPDQIVMSYDVVTMREKKINSVFAGKKFVTKKKLKIKS